MVATISFFRSANSILSSFGKVAKELENLVAKYLQNTLQLIYNRFSRFSSRSKLILYVGNEIEGAFGFSMHLKRENTKCEIWENINILRLSNYACPVLNQI
jgi:hypothetical protein